MNLRSLLHHAAGIGSLCLMALLLFAAYLFREGGLALFIVVVAFVPGYHGLRYLRGRAVWQTW
jgi:hypothetical protein